jgi:putative peptide zinc metalloprotease protein
MAFILAGTTWISTVLVNVSPFMRFDGYFLLSDWLDMPNLHGRSFALARWWLRNTLFGLDEPAPEQFSPARTHGLVAFAFAVWAYRLGLFLGIAALVYHFFFKAMGIMLFAVEIGWFVFLPIWSELRQWWARRGEIGGNRRSLFFGLGLGLALLAGLVPWQSRVSAPALLKARDHTVLYAPVAGRLERIAAVPGQTVSEGQVLFVLANPDLDRRHRLAEARRRSLDYQLSSVAFDPEFRQRAQALGEELAGAGAELQGLEKELARLQVTAPLSGRVVDIPPDLAPGQWLKDGEPLGAVQDSGRAIVEAYLSEDDVSRIGAQAPARFYPEVASRADHAAHVLEIDRVNARTLSEPAFASLHGGGVAVREKDRQLIPDHAVFRVVLEVDAGETLPATTVRGTVHIAGDRASLLGRLWRSVAAVLIRESGM